VSSIAGYFSEIGGKKKYGEEGLERIIMTCRPLLFGPEGEQEGNSSKQCLFGKNPTIKYDQDS
jgi:hypothetical protein